MQSSDHSERGTSPNYDNPDQVIKRMNHIHMLLISHPSSRNLLSQLKEYITIYVQLCEHQIISLIFGYKDQSKNTSTRPLCLQSLEIFNLLLANSNTQLQLGYILSQSSLHEGLFTNALTVTDPQFIEYYSQVLKSITMKLTQKQNRSLIRVFYNSKYPSFPLMLNCTFFATTHTEQLVKVTSRQCVLVLINLLKQKGMTPYLSQLPMLIFYARLIDKEKGHIQDVSDIGYIGDLMWAIKENGTAVLALGNAVCNLVILDNLKKPASVIKFVKHIIMVMRSHAEEDFSEKRAECLKWVRRIQTTFLNILGKFLFKKYLHSQLLAGYLQIHMGHRKIVLFPSNLSNRHLIRKLDQNCSKNFPQLQKQFNRNIEQVQLRPSSSLVLYCQQIQNYYANDREFFKLKETYNRGQKRSPSHRKGFLSSVMQKMSDDYTLGTFLNNISQTIGFKINIGRYIRYSQLDKFVQSPNAIIFMNEFCSVCLDDEETRTSSRTSKINTGLSRYEQIHLNQARNQWQMDGQFLNQVLNMVMENRQRKRNSTQEYTQSRNPSEVYNSKSGSTAQIFMDSQEQDEFGVISGTQKFLEDVKTYLQESIHFHIARDKMSINALTLLQRTCQILKTNLSANSLSSLINHLCALHSQIQVHLFQSGFSQVTQYILHPQTLQPKDNNSILIHKLTEYDLIQHILRKQKHQSLQQMHRQYLKTIEFPEEIVSFQVCYYGSQNCLMIVCLRKGPELVVQISLDGKSLLKVDLLQYHAKINPTNPTIIHCGESSEPINMITDKETKRFMEIVKRFRFTIDQTITMAVIKYLQKSREEVKKLDLKPQPRPKSLIGSKKSSIYTPN